MSPSVRCRFRERRPELSSKPSGSRHSFRRHSSASRFFAGAGRAVLVNPFPVLLSDLGRARGSGAPRDAGCFGPSRHPDVLLPGTSRRQSQRGVSASLAIGTPASRCSTAALLNPVWGRPKAFGKQPPRAPAGSCKPPAEVAPGSGFRTASGGRPSIEPEWLYDYYPRNIWSIIPYLTKSRPG